VLFFAVLHEAEVRQGAVSLALGVCGRVGKVMAEASLGVSVVMRYADGGGADHVASKVVLGVGRGPGRFLRLQQAKRGRSRLKSALWPSPLMVWLEGSEAWLAAFLFHVATLGWSSSGGVCWQVARFVGRVL
jgi:hypothetical protein